MRLRWSDGPRDFVLPVPRPGATVRQIGEPPRAEPARWRSLEQQLGLEPPSAPNPPRPPPTAASGQIRPPPAQPARRRRIGYWHG